jgi:hypothetical protein
VSGDGTQDSDHPHPGTRIMPNALPKAPRYRFGPFELARVTVVYHWARFMSNPTPVYPGQAGIGIAD